MPQLCLYFQLHQPYRLSSDYSIFEIGQGSDYFSGQTDSNAAVFRKVAAKSYLPMLQLLVKLAHELPDFRCALSASGVFLEQAEVYQPQVIELLKELSATGQAELLSETYYHSLASLYSPDEFRQQIQDHDTYINHLFGQKPTVFRNTELIFSNEVARQVAVLGFKGMLTEAVGRYLHNRPFTQVFRTQSTPSLPILLKHAPLSDDVAFRFSDKTWQWHPLTVDRYLEWVEVYGEDQLVNLFMDFETFGEHQWADTGIFEFFAEFVRRFGQQNWNTWVTPGQVCDRYWQLSRREQVSVPVYDVTRPISWADVDRDLTAWIDSPLQQDTLRILYQLQQPLLASGDDRLIQAWRRLQTSDHFYYMCTKWSADGDVHAYFSPYHSPYEAYRRYAIVLADLQERLL